MLIANQGKVEIKYVQPASAYNNDGVDVVAGLSQTIKTLPPKYFYDYLGSELFEKICTLPEYYPTRTETTILTHARAQITQFTGICELVELGSGSSTKTQLLLSAYEKLGQPWQYVPIDVSAEILSESALKLQQQYKQLSILGLVGTYEEALKQLPPSFLPSRMIIFLGSSLGNFTEAESDRFFNQVRNILQPGDYFLLGIDLQKSVEILEAAYNDSQGITAQFNLNILKHLNWRFQGNFEPKFFRHQAIYNQCEHQIEMYLHSQTNHQVNLQALDFKASFLEDEPILTEISRKFDLEQIKEFLARHNLETLQSWTDSQQWFGLILSQLQ